MENCDLTASLSSRCDLVEGEVALMQSAFGNDFEDLRDKSCSVLPSPIVRLKLGPHYTQGGTLHPHFSAVLKISTCENYPNESATVEIESYDGITGEARAILLNELVNICEQCAKKCVVVMLELSIFVQNFLSEHAKAYAESKAGEISTTQKVKDNSEKLDEENILLLKEEVARVQESFKEEARERKIRYNRGSLDDETSNRNFFPKIQNKFDQNYVKEINLTTIDKRDLSASVIANLSNSTKQFPTVHLVQDKESTDNFVLHNWWVKSRHAHGDSTKDYMLEELASDFNGVYRELIGMKKLQHPNLVSYIGMKITYENKVLNTHIVQEYVRGISLKYFLDQKIRISDALLQHVASSVLDALNYLHLSNIVHKDIKDSSIFLDHQSQTIKLSDYGVERKCLESVFKYYDSEISSSYPQSPGKGGKKGDVFRLGLILISLLEGERICLVSPTLSDNIPKDLRNFLTHCLELNEYDRWTCHQLKLHSYISSDENVDTKIANGNIEAKEGKCSTNSDTGEECCVIPNQVLNSLKGNSRFNSEYDVLEMLGSGGFGHVFKAKNKFDDNVYALKRIPLHNQSEVTKRKMTREGKLLSSLNHENVVRYFTSWIESYTSDEISDSEILKQNGEESEQSRSESRGSDRGFAESVSTEQEMNSSEDDWLMRSFKCEITNVEMSDDVLFVDSDEEVAKACKDTTLLEDTSTKSSFLKPQVPLPKRYQYLFIQMQYCEKNTLRQAIDRCLYLEKDRVLRLFREMINGLDYIHSQGLIHRDLKPGNIFLDLCDRVKIGDFGLATVAKQKACKDTTLLGKVDTDNFDISKSNLTSQVGTALYMAPELQKKSGQSSYTHKVDIYSLGIIFFEMNYNFETGMERIKVLSSLRISKPIFPNDFYSGDKKNLIGSLLNHDPTSRPSTEQLLKSPLLPPPTAEEQKFMASLESKLEKTTSKSYQDILNMFFKPRQSKIRPNLEDTFEVCLKNYSINQIYLFNHLLSVITEIFRSHGGVLTPTPFYIPRGAFYQDKDDLVSLMSKGGELIGAKYDLRYPFARYLARNDHIKRIKRFAIDRVQRAHKMSGIHPLEIYECAFDIVSSSSELWESCVKVILVVQDVLTQVADYDSSQIILTFGHSSLADVILNYCGVEEKSKKIVLEGLHNLRIGSSSDSGLNRSTLENLKFFANLKGNLLEICQKIKSLFNTKKKNRSILEKAMNEIEHVYYLLQTFKVKFQVFFNPLLVIDKNLYNGMCFQMEFSTHPEGTTSRILAKGGFYEDLVVNLRNQNILNCKRTVDEHFHAVGVSFSLDRILACVATSNKSAPIHLIATEQTAPLNSTKILTDIFLCAVEQKQVEFRLELLNFFKNENFKIDHGFASTRVEAEALSDDMWNAKIFVFLTPGEKIAIRVGDFKQGSKAMDKKLFKRQELKDDLLKFMRSLKSGVESSNASSLCCKTQVQLQLNKKDVKAIKWDDLNPTIEYVTKKSSKVKDAAKINARIKEDLIGCLTSRFNCSYNDKIDVLVLDVNRSALLALGLLDVDSTAQNFSKSIAEVKAKFSDDKEYIEKICKLISKRIFYVKKCDRCCMIFCYSLMSECLKRIF